jgi:hypothetical protein
VHTAARPHATTTSYGGPKYVATTGNVRQRLAPLWNKLDKLPTVGDLERP